MRLSYYGYYLKHKLNYGKHLVDLSPFIKSFAECNNLKLKGSFKKNDENVYLNKLDGDTCLVAMTRSSENFKKIDTSQMSVSEFSKILTPDERIGFASYAIIKPNFFGFASTSLSPKFETFANMVNHLLSITGNGSWEFCIHPLIHQATKDEAVKMDIIGKTTIEVRRENTLCQHIINVIGAGADSDDVESLEITIKPKKKKNIKRVVEKLINKASDDGIEKLVMKARNDAQSALLDLYVVGRGLISDSLTAAEENLIPGAMETRIRENEILKERLAEFLTDGQIDQVDLSCILHYSNVSAWSDFASDIHSGYQLLP